MSLAGPLAERGDLHELRDRADVGDWCSATQLARVLACGPGCRACSLIARSQGIGSALDGIIDEHQPTG